MSKGIKIGTKILMVSIPISLAAVLISSIFAGISSKNALEKAAFERLTAVRELKAQQIESYFELLGSQAVSLASNSNTFDAVSEFSYSIFLLNGLVNKVRAEDKESLDQYYDNVLARQLEESGVVEVGTDLIDSLKPTNALSISIQSNFIANSDWVNGDGALANADNASDYYKDKILHSDSFYKDFITRFGYNDVYLIAGEDNRVIYSTTRGIEFGTSLLNGPHSSSNLASVADIASGMEQGEYVFADFKKYLPALGEPTAFVAAPIFVDGNMKGVIALEMSADRINAIMTSNESWQDVGLGTSGETYLVGDDFLLRNQSRFLIEDREEYLKMIAETGTSEEIVRQIGNLDNAIGLQSVDTIGVRAALNGETDVRIFPDYRGIDVLSAYRPMKLHGLNWVIMSEIDKAEAFAEIAKLRDWLIVLASLVLAASIYASYFLSITLTRPIRLLETAARKLSSGSLDDKIEKTSSDEIGDLASSFEEMRRTLKTSFDSVEKQKIALEDEVREQTEEIQEASDQLNLALSSMPNGLHMFDKDFNFVMHNQAYIDQMDIPEELVKNGRNVIEVLRFHAERGDFGKGDPEDLAQEVFKHISTRSPKYAQTKNQKGRTIDFRYSNQSDTGGMVIVSSDITELKNNEENLKSQNDELQQIQVDLAESEKRVAKIIQSSPDGIVTIDQKGTIQTFNNSAELMFGYYADDAVGRNIKMLMAKEIAVEHDYYLERYTLGQPSSIVGNNRIVDGVRQDGTTFPLELRVEAVEMEQGEVIYIGTLRDITIRLQMEKAVNDAREQAEAANTAKSAFLANMSHELRTPMNAIIGYSEMLAEDAEDDDLTEMVADLGKITGAGKHLLSLINDILDLSKVEAGKMELFIETFDFKEIAEEVANTAKTLVEKNNNAFVVEIGDGLENVENDLTKTRQVLLNIISNAAKFTSDGTITLCAEKYLKGKTEWIRIAVRDTGIGIPEDKIDAIFQEFSQADESTTRDFGGTGLGLALTKRFAQMMGGDIRVESVIGEGSSFIIEVPLIVTKKHEGLEAEASFDEEKEESSDVTPGKILQQLNKNDLLVLVVDDELSARELLQNTMEREGYQVRTAQNGAEGLKMAADLKPDLITLDVMMPGMDGWTVLRKLKRDKNLKGIPVLMVSMVGDRAMSYELGAIDSLQKPVDRTKLRALISKYVKSASKKVLIVEDDEAARVTLSNFLKSEKWQVFEVVNGLEGLEATKEETFDLILLDLMMPVMDGFEFLNTLRNSDMPSANSPVVIVSAKDLDAEDREKLQGSVEDIIQKTGGTVDEILAEVGQLLDKRIASTTSSAGE